MIAAVKRYQDIVAKKINSQKWLVVVPDILTCVSICGIYA